MPKKQSTASRKARAAARQGEKFTRALTAALTAAGPDTVRYGWDELVLASLADVVTRHGVAPVRVEWLEEPPAFQRESERERWGVAEPASDGWLIREMAHQTAAARAVEKGTRVPVPHRTADGRVEVAALWPLVHWPTTSAGWQWAHNGWGVERPGDIIAGFDPLYPSADLPFEVRVFHVPDGVVGEDHGGSAPAWHTRAWCADVERAAELARAYVTHHLQAPKRLAHSGDVRAQVWQHDKILNTMPALLHTFDANPARPAVPHLPFNTAVPGRPDSIDPTPEPAWRIGEQHPPLYELRVWDESKGGWTSFGWFTGGRNGVGCAAVLLQVGTGGPYRWAETWGPRHPDAGAHDWIQEGRELTDHHPDMPTAEFSARLDAARQAETGLLAAALSERSGGALTVDQAADRLQAGGREYRDFLRIGQVVVLDVLHRRRRALPEGPERTAVRETLDGVELRHSVPAWLAELARRHLDADDADTASRWSAAARASRRRALQEYLAPGSDASGLPGLEDGPTGS
ncbi:hypothetical protein [Kitasatospora sp. HPMI-4]|uniref:hypothetical protein n=1 Tax=Kitasatospora sp. HPMI-4 TaxID=3448443 RepID=UPI003F1C2AD8